MTIPQKINIAGKLEKNDNTTIFFFLSEKQQKTILNLSLNTFITPLNNINN